MAEENQEVKIEEPSAAQPKKPFANAYYGDKFDGVYQKVAELRDNLPRFKEFYYSKRMEHPNYPVAKIVIEFNAVIAPERFYPWQNQYKSWRRKWDLDIMQKTLGATKALSAPEVRAIKTRDENNNLIVPTETELEAGAKTLGGELMNDAMTMLRQDQESGEDMFEDEVLVKRRHYILNVFNFVMRAVNAKEALAIKKQQEKRETASFLMDLIRRSTAGRVTPEEMSLLKDSVKPTQNVESQPAQ